MSTRSPFILLALILMSSNCKTIASSNTHAGAEKPIELALLMKNVNYFFHKLGLAIQADNSPLARFYTSELEESLQEVYRVKSHDNMPIGQVAKKIMPNAIETLAKVLKDQRSNRADAYAKVLDSCNRCHNATKHGIIVIKAPNGNPFSQDFRPLSH